MYLQDSKTYNNKVNDEAILTAHLLVRLCLSVCEGRQSLHTSAYTDTKYSIDIYLPVR